MSARPLHQIPKFLNACDHLFRPDHASIMTQCPLEDVYEVRLFSGKLIVMNLPRRTFLLDVDFEDSGKLNYVSDSFDGDVEVTLAVSVQVEQLIRK